MRQKGFSSIFIIAAVSLLVLGILFLIKNPAIFKKSSNNLPTQPLEKNLSSSEIQTQIPVEKEYYAIEENSITNSDRLYPVYTIYEKYALDQPAKKIVSLGKAGEYVSQIILVKSKGYLIINLEKKIQLFNLITKQNQDIYIADEEEGINGMTLSKKEDMLILGTNQNYNDSNIVTISLDNFVEKKLKVSELTNKEIFGYLTPIFGSGDSQVYFLHAAPIEVRGEYWVYDFVNNKLIDSKILFANHSPDGSKIIDADQLSPYGGCYPNDDFAINWYDTRTGAKTSILKGHNTIFTIKFWNPSSDQMLYSAQKYLADNSNCPHADLKEIEFFVYDFNTKQIKKVSSDKEQLKEWYPKMIGLLEEKGLNLEKLYANQVINLGNIKK